MAIAIIHGSVPTAGSGQAVEVQENCGKIVEGVIQWWR